LPGEVASISVFDEVGNSIDLNCLAFYFNAIIDRLREFSPAVLVLCSDLKSDELAIVEVVLRFEIV
jgi:hypothetical protein